MFTEGAAQYRAGIVFTIGATKYAYSMQYFMREFNEFMAKRAREVKTYDSDMAMEIPLQDLRDYFAASQSLVSSTKKTAEKTGQFTFVINGRKITCPHGSNAYVYDDALVEKYPSYFTKSISYLAMARYLKDYMRIYKKTDTDVVNDVVGILNAKQRHHAADVLPAMIAALLISESKRNPGCFIPSIMLLELIGQRQQTPFGDLYQWDNCLQFPGLVNQKNPDARFHESTIFPIMAGVPTQKDLNRNESVTLDSRRKAFVNAEKKYNKQRNQNKIPAVELCMQYGGYFPATHRFSYSELEPKRNENIATLSDVKSFIIMSDWLALFTKKEFKTQTVHGYYLKNKTQCPDIDTKRDFLQERLFPELWHKFVGFIPEQYPDDKMPFPQLLTLFGCRARKATVTSVASTLFHIHESRRFGADFARLTLMQFHIWSKHKQSPFNGNDVDAVLKRTYKLS